MSQSASLTRRRFGLAAGAVTLVGLLAACGDDEPGGTPAAADPSATTGGGTWTWTDDRGDTVSLDARPERIVVSQWLLPAFWALGIKPVGVLTFMPWGDIDGYAEAGIAEGDVTVVSENYGEVDLEALVGLQPDLIVLDSYADSETLWGFTDIATQRKAAQVAPLVAVSAETNAADGIAARHELAASLGADLEAPEVLAAQEQYDAALADVQDVVASKAGLSVAFVGPYDDGLWVAPAADYADLQILQDLGLTIWAPSPVPDGDTLSWENANDVDADVIFLDDRDDVDQAREVSPVFGRLPAVASGQVAAAWRFALPYEHAAFARALEALLPTLRESSVL